MTKSFASFGFVPVLRRLVAAGCIALVLLLGFSAASPALHQHLHADAPALANDGCAVVLFATGVTLAIAAAALIGARLVWRAVTHLSFARLYLPAPAYLRQPERGPPLR